MIQAISAIILATTFYWLGEIYNKNFKYAMGIPVGIIFALTNQSYIPILCWLIYLISTEFGYGENNWLHKLLGKRGAITFCGVALGLASFPIIGYWAILQGIVSGTTFYCISLLDDSGKIHEPWIAILRGFLGTVLLVIN